MPGGPGAPGAARGSGGVGRAVLWAVVGAAVASALWGGGVLLLGKDSGAKADLRGYTVRNDLCSSADLTAFSGTYAGGSTPTAYTTKGRTLDEMECSEGMKISATSDLSDAYVDIEVDLHKKTDPAGEFDDQWLGYRQHKPASTVVPVSGYGDEAFLVTASGSDEVTLAVRDGWVTYSMTWNSFSYEDSAPSSSDATAWVKSSTRATLAKLKS
ncbi:hypothetical protein SAMN05216259_107295 [Actinacidiphila guanduensis]|uniref:Uncharacterized protein n=2 Tax=Actinacidiphila guanduensis TaxID=310781 RepID=A0A1H0GVI5_9ACTN|nr:hypothetical protein SAMN05216259_107295 [Actinacidiphila guanduensis]